MKLVTTMRVKNEGKYLRHALRSIEPLGSTVLFLDDGSTDDTPSIAAQYTGDMIYHRQDDLPMHEGRDRTFLFHRAMELKPDWVFIFDGDEELDTGSVDRILAAIENAQDVTVFKLILTVMTGTLSEPYFFFHPGIFSMCRLYRATAVSNPKFEFTRPIHCGIVPPLSAHNECLLDAWIKYWGYETPAAVEKKATFYRVHDPDNWRTMEHYADIRFKRGLTMPWRSGPRARDYGVTEAVSYADACV